MRFEAGNSVGFEDPDGHRSYVHEFPPFMLPETDLQASSGAVQGTAQETISGGHTIVFVSNMDEAVRFYSEVGIVLSNTLSLRADCWRGEAAR